MWCARSRSLRATHGPARFTTWAAGAPTASPCSKPSAQIEALTGRKINWTYSEQARKGDHICYISNLAKFKSHYPGWSVTRSLDSILEEMVAAEREHSPKAANVDLKTTMITFFTTPKPFLRTHRRHSTQRHSKAGSASIPKPK